VVWPEPELRKIGLRRRHLERDVAFSVCAIFGGKWASVAQPLASSAMQAATFQGSVVFHPNALWEYIWARRKSPAAQEEPFQA
jgi:hypothetical protein